VPVRRRARGSISRSPSGSLRVRVYAGPEPITGRERYLSETVGTGPAARARAEEACRRLLGRVRRRRCLRTDATVNELLHRFTRMLDGVSGSARASLGYQAGVVVSMLT
jgi:integrase